MLQHAQKYRIEKISVPRLLTGLDKLNCLKIKGSITDVFHNSPIKVAVYTQPQQQNSILSWTQIEKRTKNVMQQTQKHDQSLSTVLSWFTNLKVVNDILLRSFEDSNASQSRLQVVPTSLRPKVLESIHSSTTAAQLGVAKTLERLRTRFYWLGHKKDVSVFVSS